MRRLRDRLSPPEIMLLLSVTAYTIFWSIISIMRYRSFNMGVYDLGVNSSLLYSVLHEGRHGVVTGMAGIAFNKLIYLVVALPYSIDPDPVLLLVMQSAWIAAGAIPVYYMVKYYLNDSKSSLLVSISYLLYYPLSGVNWFDFHYMSLFPVLFLAGVCLHLYGKNKSSVLAMALAVATDFLAPVIVGLYSLYIIWSESRSGEKPIMENRYAIALLLTSIILFGLVLLNFGESYLANLAAPGHTTISPAGQVHHLLLDKLLYPVYLTIPLLMLPFLAPEVLLVSVPYFIFAFVNNYYPYVAPIHYQYPALTAPVIFIALISALRKISSGRIKKISRKHMKQLIRWTAVVTVALYIIMMPLGVYEHTQGNQDAQTLQYSSHDAVLSSMMKLIPRGSSVMIQGNMPQLTSGYFWLLPAGLNMSDPPQYAIDDPYQSYFNNSVILNGHVAQNEVSAFNTLLDSGEYSILSENSGIMLIELNYSGSPQAFVPISRSYGGSSLSFVNGSTQYVYTPQGFYAPGIYSVAVTVKGQLHNTNGILISLTNSTKTASKQATAANGASNEEGGASPSAYDTTTVTYILSVPRYVVGLHVQVNFGSGNVVTGANNVYVRQIGT